MALGFVAITIGVVFAGGFFSGKWWAKKSAENENHVTAVSVDLKGSNAATPTGVPVSNVAST
eukprot:CAMPEP_0196718950 /NCGR_PEP_ID=MMETSP1091-20130531/2024_1 /TAXON_ID=302021 /ORGANISM="Rhodomonas sp., Strain CCMP768" /LENGTH=61 /DNA_ID=CAMNT_0042059749 /DNA_START=15 /DNA_END=200 /DNA_ORIENTATION=+